MRAVKFCNIPKQEGLFLMSPGNRPQTLPAFTPEEYKRAHLYLATQVANMMGRKMEEEDWAHVYCKAKGIRREGWSNLNIDVMHGILGVEHKMLRNSSRATLVDLAGTTQMHPAATRSIRIDDTNRDPNDVMVDVFGQYHELIEHRRRRVLENSGGNPRLEDIDMRTGWLLWETELREFIYFEERMAAPNPADLWAEWNVTPARGSRKSSKSLWVYEKETGKKRYSVTTSAGIKIQPYFDVPSPKDPNFYFFRVQGELMTNDLVRLWVTNATARELKALLGSLETEAVSAAVAKVMRKVATEELNPEIDSGVAQSVLITREAYEALSENLEAVSDEHRMQLFVKALRTA